MTAARPLTRAILALGSNLGEREGTLQSAVADLVDLPEVRLQNVSPVVRTKAVGGPEGQPDFLNMVIAVDTTLSPYELLAHCQAIELAHHRTREVRWGARTLDIDIIVYGEISSEDPVLTLPHPRASGRAFVLYPWSLMEPHATLAGESVAELAAAAPDMPGTAHVGDEPPGTKAQTGKKV
ncbi:2-amino-4-hydroxy-6-hydroxymethyldihydropteridine diphosphokinase [Arthrobacter sp. LAPM80]|uniref:2-amino-4-hydroxy-6- hydroxymethyldihydropteridine diphosphokinase n=1 Tax=Arthrobacter sp. LAPM80 TaxID=3141788 RepID=UPI00398A55B9